MDIRDIIEELEEQIEHFRLTREEKIEVLERLDSHPLSDAIADQLGVEDGEELIQTLRDVCRGGANAGFGGFVSHKEMEEFFDDNKDELLKLVTDLADEFGFGVLEFVQGFNCIGKDWSLEEIGKVLFGDSKDSTIIDGLCWFALEDFARLAE